jgi:uncharacterized protein YjbI with pentapeptide repeats
MIAPDLPELEPYALPSTAGDLVLSGVLIEGEGRPPVPAGRIRVRESELHGVRIEADHAPGLELVDVVLRGCGLTNVDAREGLLRRVVVRGSQLVGFGLSGGQATDVSIVDSSLELASFAGTTLRSVRFERVNLSEVSFQYARLEMVEFVDCRLTGADFRRAKLRSCAIRGASLESVVGVDSLRGLQMPWEDVLASAGALASALGIAIEDQ